MDTLHSLPKCIALHTLDALSVAAARLPLLLAKVDHLLEQMRVGKKPQGRKLAREDVCIPRDSDVFTARVPGKLHAKASDTPGAEEVIYLLMACMKEDNEVELTFEEALVVVLPLSAYLGGKLANSFQKCLKRACTWARDNVGDAAAKALQHWADMIQAGK